MFRLCSRCGYDLRGSEFGQGVCPECGMKYHEGQFLISLQEVAAASEELETRVTRCVGVFILMALASVSAWMLMMPWLWSIGVTFLLIWRVLVRRCRGSLPSEGILGKHFAVIHGLGVAGAILIAGGFSCAILLFAKWHSASLQWNSFSMILVVALLASVSLLVVLFVLLSRQVRIHCGQELIRFHIMVAIQRLEERRREAANLRSLLQQDRIRATRDSLIQWLKESEELGLQLQECVTIQRIKEPPSVPPW